MTQCRAVLKGKRRDDAAERTAHHDDPKDYHKVGIFPFDPTDPMNRIRAYRADRLSDRGAVFCLDRCQPVLPEALAQRQEVLAAAAPLTAGRQQAQPAQLVPVVADAEAVVHVVRAQAARRAQQQAQAAQLVPVAVDAEAVVRAGHAQAAVGVQLAAAPRGVAAVRQAAAHQPERIHYAAWPHRPR